MQRIFVDILFVSFVLTVLLLSSGCARKRVSEDSGPQQDSIPPLGFFEDRYRMVEDKVKDGEIFTALMSRLGMEHQDALALAGECGDVFDVRKMRAGNTVKAYYGEGEAPQYVVYDQDRIHRVIFKTADSLAAWLYSRPVEVTREYADVTINSSLWNDMVEAGAPTMLIVSLSEIYAWSVDFFALQEGDRFKVLFDKKSCEGEFISVDTIYYAEYISGDTVIPAIMYDQGDGGISTGRPTVRASGRLS